MGKRAYSLLDTATYARHYQVVFSDLSWRLGSSVSYYKWRRWSRLLDERADWLTSHPARGNYSVSSFRPWNTFYKVDVQNFRAQEEVDWKTANEIWDFEQHGTLVNSRNNIFNRMSHNTQHISTGPQKAIAAKWHEAQMSKIHEKITDEKALCKQSMLRQKELQVELESMTSSTGWGFGATAQSLPLLQGSSSGSPESPNFENNWNRTTCCGSASDLQQRYILFYQCLSTI